MWAKRSTQEVRLGDLVRFLALPTGTPTLGYVTKTPARNRQERLYIGLDGGRRVEMNPSRWVCIWE